jgi:MYXO-CTERM domain-containing protein
VGTEANDSDALTQAARQVGPQFFFVSHTFDHHRLDTATYAQMTQELTSNDTFMQKYAFGPYDRTSLVTPDISGLANAQVMQAALDFGIERLVCDATVASCRGATRNTGLPNPLVPGMFMIPRLATNLYANVSTPDEWVASYNALNGGTNGGARSIGQILDSESTILLTHLLEGDINPVMFHQANLRAYDGTHALITDLIDEVVSKYAALRVLPIVSLPMDEMGARMQDRAAFASGAITATISPGRSITIRSTQAVRVPVTGAVGANAESYGAVTISRVTVAGGAEVTLPLVRGMTDGGVGTDGGTDGGAAGTSLTRTPDGTGGPGTDKTGGCGCGLVPTDTDKEGPSFLAVAFLAGATIWRRRRSQRRSRVIAGGCYHCRTCRFQFGLPELHGSGEVRPPSQP